MRKSIKESISLETLRNEEHMILEMIDSLKNNKKFNPYEGKYVICCDFFTDKIEFYYIADDVVSHRDIVVGYCDSLKDANLIINELSNKFKFFESKKSARKVIKEQFVGKGKGGYRKPSKTKFNSGVCLDSNGVKHTVIFDTHVEDFIVWVDDNNYLMWYVSSPQSLLNNLAESDLDENLILDIVALWEKLPKKRIKN